jgi:nitroimidazol reductase NimA-like FMN-containing flavoprotein (pyridoxamine 5'-phosphate oxidase superfamily)
VFRLSYARQAPPLTSEEIESMLKGNRFARICTHNEDGTIHATPVSYRYINGQILILTNIESRKVKNIKRNNDVTVLVDEVDTLRGIQIHGTAEIDYDNIYEEAPTVLENARPVLGVPKEKLERIAKAYVDTFKLVILRITPKHIESFDYGKYELWSDWGKTLSSIIHEKQA